MRRELGTLGAIAAITVVPMALGVLVVGPAPPSGRNTRSATRVGHKAVHRLFEHLGYRVRRFERGLERPPPDGSSFLAVEPGPFLFREAGRFARPLVDWIRAGNGALITLGPDPDRAAELDDRGQILPELTEKAVEIAKEVAREVRARRDVRPPGDRDDPGETAPGSSGVDSPSGTWRVGHLAALFSLPLAAGRLAGATSDAPCALAGPLANELGSDPKAVLTRPRTWEATGSAELRTLLSACGEPIVFEARLGKGRVLFVAEPRLFHNGRIRSGAHARLAVRLVERLARHVGSDLVYFEEFSHGGREIANIFELAVRSKARWPLLQLLVVAVVWVLFAAPRRRSIVPLPQPSRRSKSEIIDGMATLYSRAGDVPGAARRLCEVSRGRLARSFGLVGEDSRSPRSVAVAYERRFGTPAARVSALLSPEGVRRPKELLERCRALRSLRLTAAAPELGSGGGSTPGGKAD